MHWFLAEATIVSSNSGRQSTLEHGTECTQLYPLPPPHHLTLQTKHKRTPVRLGMPGVWLTPPQGFSRFNNIWYRMNCSWTRRKDQKEYGTYRVSCVVSQPVVLNWKRVVALWLKCASVLDCEREEKHTHRKTPCKISCFSEYSMWFLHVAYWLFIGRVMIRKCIVH